MIKKQVVALGGGGFLMEGSPLIDDYILGTASCDRPSICFIPTASADSDNFIAKFYNRFARSNCVPHHLELFKRTEVDLEKFVCSQDIIYVGGGNTANMLAIWRAHGLDVAIRQAYHQGTVMSGISAGSICWFESGVTDSFGSALTRLDCLGILPGSNCPHYDGEPERRPAYHRLIKEGLPGGFAADDSCALHFVDEKLFKIISSKPNARGYSVSLNGSAIEETGLETELLS